MANKLKAPASGAASSAPDASTLSVDVDIDIDDLVKRVTDCLSIDENYPELQPSTKELCVRNAILGLIREGLDDLSVLARRIEASLSPAALSGEATGKKDLLELSKDDEWYLIQELQVAEERESLAQRLARKKEDQAAKRREHSEYLRQQKLRKEDQRRQKAVELQLMKQKRSELEAEARRERAARRHAGESVRADREEQVKRAKEKHLLHKKLKKVVDEQEKQAVMRALREEQLRLTRERQQAREDMQSVLEENQKSLEQKREEAQREKDAAIRCMEEYSKMLLHQEQERQRQLERIHEIQRAQEQASNVEIVAAGTKNWIDDAVVAKQAEQRELRVAQQEREASEAMQKRNDDILKALDQQVKDKQENRAAEQLVKAAEKKRLAELDRQCKENHQAAIQRAADKCMALKRGLDLQIIEQRKGIRARIGMNHPERALNAQMLQKASAQGRTTTRDRGTKGT